MGIRLTGVSAFGFGLDWEMTKSERQLAREVVVFLEDRRVLFGERHLEDERYCIQSALEIRTKLTECLASAKPDKGLQSALRAMRASARRFVEAGGPHGRDFEQGRGYGVGTDRFSIALGELRASFGVQLALILTAYPMEIESELAQILPPADDDGQDLSWLPGEHMP